MKMGEFIFIRPAYCRTVISGSVSLWYTNKVHPAECIWVCGYKPLLPTACLEEISKQETVYRLLPGKPILKGEKNPTVSKVKGLNIWSQLVAIYNLVTLAL